MAQIGQYTAHQEFYIDVFSVGAGAATGANAAAPAVDGRPRAAAVLADAVRAVEPAAGAGPLGMDEGRHGSPGG